MPDNDPKFRPPAEAASLILQVDEGCPHNACAFCGMYRRLRFRRRTMEEIREIVAAEAAVWPEVARVFLADGDVMRRPFEELAEILRLLRQSFPALSRVNLYAAGSGILDKTAEQLRQLKALKLHTFYLGLESGDEEILRKMNKAETAAKMIQAVEHAQAAGLRASVIVLLGLGGRERSREHAEQTAAALNRMRPRLLSLLRVTPIPNTPLGREVRARRFAEVSEYGVLEEMRRLVANLDLPNTVFRANHASNVTPLEGRLPRDKARLLMEMDRLLQSGLLDRQTPGAQTLLL